ncbi:hypothetical protein [Candidatus Thiosymbion oneisti]|uniref:hypothetical protein n=1 Tax=Candidatus Thiosymbion oneisti TaxID=589554 RepID=UPI000B7CDC6B|nr:hypothetical protein [Candidatus Thiosymbion oneisti]
MAQLVVRLESEEKAKLLSEFLSALNFVSSVELAEDRLIPLKTEEDFFSLAGLWKGRNIIQDSIRKSAWRETCQ